MIYIFTHLGEFGIELLNWQGVVRKFSRTIPASDRIVCCSRANVYPLYEVADVYLDIGDVELWRNTRASGYFARHDPPPNLLTVPVRLFDRRLKNVLRATILDRLRTLGEIEATDQCVFVFSSDGLSLNGCNFGHVSDSHSWARAVGATLLGAVVSVLPARGLEYLRGLKNALRGAGLLDPHLQSGEIYGELDVRNNEYRRIEPDLSVLDVVSERAGWDLNEPYVLCQMRTRHTPQASQDALPRRMMKELLASLAKEIRVVLLSFHTGRWLDSYSEFEDLENCVRYDCRAFPEQACLIHFSDHCLFFTEGDLGSHIYLPPLMGRDVTAVAPASVFELPSAPIEFWNQHVFTCGGQVIPQPAEELSQEDGRLAATVTDLLQRTARQRQLRRQEAP